MKKLRLISLVMTVCLLLAAMSPCALALDKPEIKSARSVLVGDMDSGRILLAENAYTRSEPASITKMMTVLLAVEAIERDEASLDDMVTASKTCNFDLTEDSRTSNIYPGEVMSLKDLLYCAALASANEACNIIAEHISGSVEAFVEKMNERAEELGCTGTHFVNTHGLPDPEHCTTARDLFLIACEAMKHEQFAELCGTASYTTAATNNANERSLSNSNALINAKSVYGDHYVYEGAKGIKTGHTDAAGFCLVSAAERDGVKLIAVVLGASGDTEKREHFDNFDDSISVLDWAFDNFSYRTLVSKEDIVGTQPVLDGEKQGKINLSPTEAISALVPDDINVYQLKKEIKLYNDSISEVKEGDELGELTLSDADGTVFGTVKLVAAGDIVYGEASQPQNEQPAGLSDMQRNAIYIVCGILLLILIVVIIAAVRRRRYVKARRRKAEMERRNRK